MKRLVSDRQSISTAGAAVVVIIVIIVAAVAAVVFLSSPGTSTTSSSSTPRTITITFGATLSLTGNLMAFGVEQNWTLNKAVADINAFGGIPLQNGSHALVKLIVLDDQSKPTIGQSNLQTLATTDHATVILGELGGVQDSVAQSFSSANQIPYIGPVYISQFKTCAGSCSNAWIFSPFENETNEAHIFLNWFKTVVTPSSSVKISFFSETGDPAAQANTGAGEAYATQLGYAVCTCSDTSFTPLSQSEMTAFIQGAKTSNVTAIYGLPLPPDAVMMVNTAKANGFTPKAWLMTRGTAVAPFSVIGLGGLGNLSSGVMSAFPWQPAVPYTGMLFGHNESNPVLVGDYEAVFHHPPTLEGVYYTEALVAADAIAAASNLTNVAIRQALRTGTFQTPMGVVNFTPGGQWVQSEADILLMQWQIIGGGPSAIQALQILEPTSIATTSYLIYPFTYWNSTSTQQTRPWP
ncbi:MAG: ABC transporter substrate-binding protein [Nitrososphaerales archaeon]